MKRIIKAFFGVLLASLLAVPTSLMAKDFKVISYNIRNSGAAADDGVNCWENRKPATLKLFRAEKPDMIGMQEVLPDQLEYMTRHMHSRGYRMVGVGRDDGAGKGENMCIYYNSRRFRLLDSNTHWLSATPDEVSLGWDGACRRTVTYVLLQEKRTGKQIAYLNTHLDHVGPVARRESVLLLCKLINDMVPAGVPVILGGDMNSTIDDDIFTPLSTKSNLKAAREVSPVTDNRGTYNGWGRASSVIDHIFFRDVTPIAFRCLDGDYGAPYISDHYPVSFTFRF